MAKLTLKKNPRLPVEPTYHDPARCHNCGHVGDHVDGVGCTVPGGTKYVEDDETGEGYEACTCMEFVPVPSDQPVTTDTKEMEAE